MKSKTLVAVLISLLAITLVCIIWRPWFNKFSCDDVAWDFTFALVNKDERKAIKWVSSNEQQNVRRWISASEKIDCGFLFMDENIITFSVGSPTDNGGHYSLYYTCGKPYYELWVNLWMSITDDGCKIVDLNACEKFENFSNYLNSESDCE